jgi:hypothetical protein
MKDPCKNCLVKPICGGNPLSVNCCQERLEYLTYNSIKRLLVYEFLLCSSKICFVLSLLILIVKELK